MNSRADSFNSGASTLALLGAGASYEAGLPLSDGLARAALKEADLADEPVSVEAFRRICRIIAGAIIYRHTQNGRDPTAIRVNVEDIAEGLAFLDSSKYWKFGDLFGNLHPAVRSVEDWYRRKADRSGLAKQILKVIESTGKERDHAATMLAWAILERDLFFPSFLQQSLAWLLELCFAELEQRKGDGSYLDPLTRSTSVSTIATLNFDTLVEESFDRVGRPYDVGVLTWRQGHLHFDPSSVPLLKLHGSINWSLESDDPDGIWSPREGPAKVTQSRPGFGFFADKKPCVLFGTPAKLKANGPYLDLFRAFENGLEMVQQVAIIGYSFSDSHINDALQSWLRKDRANRMYIASKRLSSSFSEREEFDQLWDGEQVIDTGLGASDAIYRWFPA